MREFGLKLKKAYIQLIWKNRVEMFFNGNPEPLFKLARELNKTNYELRQIRSRKKAL